MKTPTILVQAVTVLALTLAALPTQAAASTPTAKHLTATVTPGRDAVATEQAAPATPVQDQAREKEHKDLVVVAYSVMSLLHLCLVLPGFSGRSLRRRDFAFGAQAAA